MISALFRRAMLMLNERTNYVMMMMMMISLINPVVVRVEESLKADLFTDELNRKRRLSQTNKMKLPAAFKEHSGWFLRAFACLLFCMRWWSCGCDGPVAGWWWGWICFWRGTEIFLLGSGWIFHEGTHIMVPLLLQVQDLAATTSHLAIWAKSSAILLYIYRFFYRWIWKVLLSPKYFVLLRAPKYST